MTTDKSPPSGDRVLDEELLGEDQAAKALHVQKQTMSAWRQRGQGPAFVRIGKLIKYRPSDLRAYVASRVVRPQKQGACDEMVFGASAKIGRTHRLL
jgi:hypothetical protein